MTSSKRPTIFKKVKILYIIAHWYKETVSLNKAHNSQLKWIFVETLKPLSWRHKATWCDEKVSIPTWWHSDSGSPRYISGPSSNVKFKPVLISLHFDLHRYLSSVQIRNWNCLFCTQLPLEETSSMFISSINYVLFICCLIRILYCMQ